MPIQKITTGVIDSIANTQISGTITTSQLSGSITSDKITSVNANTITTGTLPSARLGSDVMVSGNMPAFSASPSVSQTIGSSTYTKLLFGAEEFDTNNNFASSRFTPTVAGYYQVNAAFQVGAFFTTGNLAIYKNGTRYKVGFATGGVDGTTGIFATSTLVYCNGTTDYIEAFGFIRGGQALDIGSEFTYFNGSMVRGA